MQTPELSTESHSDRCGPKTLTPSSRRILFPCLNSPSKSKSLPHDIYLKGSDDGCSTQQGLDLSPAGWYGPAKEEGGPPQQQQPATATHNLNVILTLADRDESPREARQLCQRKTRSSPTSPRRSLFPTVSSSVSYAPKLNLLTKKACGLQDSLFQVKSCLRVVDPEVGKVSSVESDLPSLASTSSQSSFTDLSPRYENCFSFIPLIKKDAIESTTVVNFDPKVWVREFERTELEKSVTWYTNEDLECFKLEAMKKISKYNKARAVKVTNTSGGKHYCLLPSSSKPFLFSHRALGIDGAEDQAPSSCEDEAYRSAVLNNEMSKILIVDPYDICLKLFAKAFKAALPHTTIVTAKSAQQALSRVEQHKKFDVVLVEERLKTLRRHCEGAKDFDSSGSSLIRKLQESIGGKPLFIATSAHIQQDKGRLNSCGADFLWGKPPPSMTPALVDDLLRTLLIKRGRGWVLKGLFK